ncbi:hypothetical protein BN1708_009241 [Verticillium longisporum]|uniref:Amino acid transporter transmembrane domain-containing protein n=1 Tax=Verticillium longisporum TaxID=100787 RepID=A0A0G4KEZ8_VERLO|nr:hypothetical protein BN1708_009241 [Verticillium longisporum]
MDHDEIVQSRYADANSDKKAQDVKQAEDSEKMAQEEAIAPQFSRGAPFGEVVGEDYVKSIWALGIIEIFIYTLTGALIYAFVGQEVRSPALLSAGPTVSKVAFGVALPVIFISGSINTTVVGRYIHGRMYKDSIVRYINTKMGWITWLALITVITVIAWIIAEAIPFFSELLSISSSLFISGFTFYFPAIMWFMLIKEGKWNAKENLLKSAGNGLAFVIGIVVLVCGTYASIEEINLKFRNGTVSSPFSCAPLA